MPIKTGIFNSDLPHHLYNKIKRLALVAVGFGRFLLAANCGKKASGRNPSADCGTRDERLLKAMRLIKVIVFLYRRELFKLGNREKKWVCPREKGEPHATRLPNLWRTV